MTENLDLDALRAQVASGTPLAKETVIALINRTEAAESAATDLFDEASRQKKRANAAEALLPNSNVNVPVFKRGRLEPWPVES